MGICLLRRLALWRRQSCAQRAAASGGERESSESAGSLPFGLTGPATHIPTGPLNITDGGEFGHSMSISSRLSLGRCPTRMSKKGGFMRFLKVVALMAMCVLGLSLLAGASENKFGVADSGRITFDEPIRVGNTLLPSGDYQVLHTMNGERHI